MAAPLSAAREVMAMPWYWIALLVCLVIGPFDALYLYIRSERRKDALKRGREQDAAAGKGGRREED